MAKVQIQVSLRRNDGSPIGNSITSEKPTKSEALDAISVVIQQRVDSAQAGVTELVEAQTAFNS